MEEEGRGYGDQAGLRKAGELERTHAGSASARSIRLVPPSVIDLYVRPLSMQARLARSLLTGEVGTGRAG